VNPRYRRKGLAQKLFVVGTQRAKELGAKVSQVSIPESDAGAKCLVRNMGFSSVRRFLELKLDIYNMHLPPVKPGALLCRRLRNGEEDRLTQIQNRAFAGSWGFNPNTVEDVTYRVSLRDCSPEDVVMAYKGNRAVAYCWTTVDAEKNALRGEKRGRVHMLGVDPDCRKMGFGKEILLAGLTHLRSRGIQVVDLTSDSKNQAARRLYDSFGFERSSTTVWYEKILI
jgi:mycothiol synthase